MRRLQGGTGVIQRVSRSRTRSVIYAAARPDATLASPRGTLSPPATPRSLDGGAPAPGCLGCCGCLAPVEREEPLLLGPRTRWQRVRIWSGTEAGRSVVLSLGYATWCIVFGCLFVVAEVAVGNQDFFYGPTIFLCFQAITTGGFGYPSPGQYPTSDVVRALYIFYNIGGACPPSSLPAGTASPWADAAPGLFLLTAMLTAVGELAETLQATVLRRVSARRESAAAAKERASSITAL
jgi:hypothetical protein